MRILQKGRSMVEMLAVLAVIGLLSTAGIKGYTAAMAQYRANETLEQLRFMTYMISQARMVGQTPDLSQFGGSGPTQAFTTRMGYPINYYTGQNQFSIEVHVPNKVCQLIFGMGYNQPFAIYTTEDTAIATGNGCGVAETVPMSFYYTNDLAACANCQPEKDAGSKEVSEMQ